MKRIISMFMAVMLTMFTAACALAAQTNGPQLEAKNGKIIVTNAVENGTLILAFYSDGWLVGANTYRDSSTIEVDMSIAPESADKVKAFYWNMENIMPLGNMIDLPIGNIPTEPPTQKCALTVYFSCTGNTKDLAEKIAQTAGTDLYEIVPEIPYTSDDLNYNNNSSRANQEMNNPDARPAISGSIENISDYDTIILGYPIWWGTIPRIINTFLESYDLSGKTIMPFCTSGSTGISGSVSEIRNAYPDITITEGFRGTSSTTTTQIEQWLTDNGFEINTEKPTIEPTEEPKKEDNIAMVKVGDKEFTITLYDNETAAAFKAMLPMTLDMNELNGNEKYYNLPNKLPTNTENVGTINAGDIMLYGSNCIVLFYKTFNTSYSYTRIGHINDVTGLAGAVGGGNVTVTFE